MSGRRSTSAMGPPADRDVVMGPPPLPPPVSQQAAEQQKPKDTQEITEKYRKLKRRYFELEEVSLVFCRLDYIVLTWRQKHKETATELQRSGERNVKMRGERECVNCLFFHP